MNSDVQWRTYAVGKAPVCTHVVARVNAFEFLRGACSCICMYMCSVTSYDRGYMCMSRIVNFINKILGMGEEV